MPETATLPRTAEHCRTCRCEPPDSDHLSVHHPNNGVYGHCETCGRDKWRTELHVHHRGSPRRSDHCGCCTHPHDLEPGAHTIPTRAGRENPDA